MEKEIIGEEIDLRSYLEVIWKNKFLIVTVIMISLVLSAYYSFFMLQNEYQTDSILYIKNLPADLSNSERYSNPAVIISIITSNEVLAKTVEQSGLAEVEPFRDSKTPRESAENWLKQNIQAKARDKMIDLSLKGTLEPEILQKIMQTDIKIVVEENRNKLIQDTENEKITIDTLIATLNEQKIKTSADLEKTLAENSSDRVVMIERFLGLNSRLIATEDKLNAMQISKKNLEVITSPDFNWIEVISPPYKPENPTGPRRMLNIGIAGVLGTFIGVLAAFVKSYMEGSVSRRRGSFK